MLKVHRKMDRRVPECARGCASLVSIVLLLANAPAFAQEHGPTGQAGDTAASSGLADIIVTARRVGESAQKTPVAITAISPVQLERKALTNISEISKSTPSLSIYGSSSSPTGLYFNMRGQVASDTAIAAGASVGVYLDDEFAGSAPIAGGLLDFSDVERVEILKGPQGTLYGRNVTGGVVKFVTNKPTDKLEAYVKGGLGNYDRHYLNGMVNVPLAGDKLAMRVVGTFDEHSGYSYDVINKRDLDDMHRWMIRGELLAKPADNLEILLTGYYGKAHDNGADLRITYAQPTLNPTTLSYMAYHGINGLTVGTVASPGPIGRAMMGIGTPADFAALAAALPATLAGLTAESNAPRNQAVENPLYTQFDRTELKGATGNVSLDLGNVVLRSITGYQYAQNHRAFNVGGGSAPPLPTTQYGSVRQFSQEFQVNGKGMGGKLKYALGFYYIRSTFRDDRDPGNVDGFAPLVFGRYGLQFTNPATSLNAILDTANAAYGQFTYAITDNVHFTGGLRYTDESVTAKSYSAVLNYDLSFKSCASPAGGFPTDPADATNPAKCGIASASVNATNWSYTAGLDWTISPGIMVYAKTSRGFKTGGVNEFVAVGQVMQPFDPESDTDYEVGLKADFLDRRARLNLAYYHTNYDNIQRTISYAVPGSIIATATRNAASAKIDGVEVEATLKPVEALTLGGTLAYTDARYGKYTTLYADGVTVKDLSGLPFQSLAKWTYTLSAGYDLPVGENNAHAQIDWSHRSKANLFENDLLPNSGPTGTDFTPAQYLEQPGYGLLDLSLTVEVPSIRSTVTVWGKNVLNKRYYVSMIGLVNNGVGQTYGNFGAPATVGVDWKVAF